MKSNAPWSVKGIERDARETAKEAAKREGMTVGEWLNQMIYSAGDPESSGGHVEGLKLRDVVTAIDHLHKRIADSAAETGDAVTDVSRKMGDVVERVQRLERTKAPGGDRERVDALKALEKAVSQVAVQFSNAQKTTLERLDETEQSIKSLTAQVSATGVSESSDTAGFSHLKDAVDGMQTRLARAERLVGEAGNGDSGGDPEFKETTSNRLRVLGDEIKRGGDQIRTLEATIAKLSQQIEAAERRSAEGVQNTAETLAELRESFSGETIDTASRDEIAAVVADQTRDTTDRVERLQASFEDMISRLDALGSGETPVAAKAEAGAADAFTNASPDEAAALDDTDEPNISPPTENMPEFESISDEPSVVADEPAKLDVDDSDDDDDDDFFSFTDDIDASIDETPTSERDDDFSFELDGDSKEDADPAGAEILSEVQNAFSGNEETSGADNETDDEQGSVSDDPDKASVDKELDELLAGLDDVKETKPDVDDTAAEAPPVVEDAPADERNDASPSKEDLLKSIRRKAREEAASRAVGADQERPTRRKLTPKQKAILAARARRKRLAEQKGDGPEDAMKAAATKKALEAGAFADEQEDFVAYDDDAVDDDKKVGRFAALRNKLPFFGGSKENENEDEDAHATVSEEDSDGDREALETLKSTASARPVTLALGVGIFLTIGVAFFALKDFVFAPRGDVAPSVSPASVATVNEPAAEPTLEAPEPPAVDPTTLYRDAMTGLNAAGNDAETSVAIEKLEQAALLGHPPAQLQLGELYKTGQGVDPDLAQARTWFRRAANGGNVLAMHRVGVMTARGEGGSANTPEAISWFEQAANRGLVDSQYNLGAIYHPSGEGEAGAGDLQDAGKAYYWYSLAANNGDEQASPLASGVGAALSEAQRADLDEAIAAWAPLPADIEANTLANAG